MHKNILVAGIIILFIMSALAPITFGSNVKTSIIRNNGNMLYVGGSGPNNYTTIQSAINDANHGDTVFVYDDSSPYVENVVVNKSINLIGEDRDTTVIDGGGDDDVVYVSAHGVNVSGFTIRKSGNNRYPNFDAGIDIRSRYSIIYSNKISNNGNGIYIDGYFGSGNYNNITDNIISNNDNGIKLYDSYGNYITGNNILNNDDGMSLISSGGNNITGNNILNNDDGIKLLGNNNTISGNTISSNKWHGIWVNSDKNTIDNNTISNNDCGVYLTFRFIPPMTLIPSISNRIYWNIISNNGYGIYLNLSLFNHILKNNFINNKEDAFFIDSFLNRWKQNYWNESRILPKLIHGELIIKFGIPPSFVWHIPWINIDWHPARKPYDI